MWYCWNCKHQYTAAAVFQSHSCDHRTELQRQGYVWLNVPALLYIDNIIDVPSWMDPSARLFVDVGRGVGRAEMHDVQTPSLQRLRFAGREGRDPRLRVMKPRTNEWLTLLDEIWTTIEPTVRAHIEPDSAVLRYINVMWVKPGATAQPMHFDLHTKREGENMHRQNYFTVLVPLTSHGPAAGGTLLIPGSHLWPGSSDRALDDAAAAPDRVVITSELGQLYIFNGNVAHFGMPNATRTEHRVFAYYVVGDFATDPNIKKQKP